MTFNNGATDGKSDSHTVILSALERIEEPGGRLRVETDSRVLHGQANAITFVLFGFDQQLPGTIVDGTHRVGCVREQVQYNLLKLHAISRDKREVAGEFQAQNHLILLKCSRRKRDYFSCGLFQVDLLGWGILFVKE